GTKPKVEAGFAEQLGAAITKPKPRAIEKPETKAAVPAPLGFTQSPAVAPPVADGEVLELDPAAPFDNAQKLVSLRAWHPSESIRTWQYWQRSFWQWTSTHWREVDDDTVRASVWHELNAAEKLLKGGKARVRYEPKMQDVNATLDALKAAVNL